MDYSQYFTHLKTLSVLLLLSFFFACNTSSTEHPSGPAANDSVPSAPTDVKGLAGNAQAAVSWAIPVIDGGSVITGYTVISVQDTTKHCTSTSASTCIVVGLTNGTAYSFTVTATNVIGTSAASLPSALVTPSSIPAVNWTLRNSGMTGYLNSVTWTGTQFIAVGDYSVLASPDEIIWGITKIQCDFLI